jgi:NAD(P)-dependent dehydrogenase (short-subunit alcohol dehydrogenase family)
MKNSVAICSYCDRSKPGHRTLHRHPFGSRLLRGCACRSKRRSIGSSSGRSQGRWCRACIVRTRPEPVQASERLVHSTLDRFGRNGALLNIAGAVPQIDLFEMTDEQWKAGMELKLHGARRLTIHAWEALKQSKGSVVFMSGSEALDPKPALAAVAATNATNVAITALAKAFGEQGIKDGVQVNSIVPGAVMTGRRRSFLEKWAPAHNISVEER